MTFPPADKRTGWKKPRTRRIDAKERDRLHEAIRAYPDDLEVIARRFGLGVSTVQKHAKLAHAGRARRTR